VAAETRAASHPVGADREDPRGFEWSEAHPLVRRILHAPRDFEFFQLLHLIERIDRTSVPLGGAGPARAEGVRLRPVVSLGFPVSDVDAVEWREYPERGRLVVTTTFLGLYGSDSPLATHFTEALLLEREDDERVRDFLDIFHHRLLSLLFRVWVKYRYYAVFRSDGSDNISLVVRGLLGLGTAALDEFLRIHPVRLFRYAGLFSQRPRSAAGLIGLLRDYFEGVDFDVQQCVGRWLRIQPGDRNACGLSKCTLGQDLLLGERIFDRSGKFRVKVGPVGLERYLEFLPPGRAAGELRSLVEFYCGDPLEFDIQVTLRGEEVPDTPLGERGLLGRLSWTSWLKSGPCGDKTVVFTPPPESA